MKKNKNKAKQNNTNFNSQKSSRLNNNSCKSK